MYTENILLPPAYSLSKTDVYITDTRTPLVWWYTTKIKSWAAIRIGISLITIEKPTKSRRISTEKPTDKVSSFSQRLMRAQSTPPERQLNSSAHFPIRSVDIFFLKKKKNLHVQFFFNSPLCTRARNLNIKRTKNWRRDRRGILESSLDLSGSSVGKFLPSSYVTISLYVSTD